MKKPTTYKELLTIVNPKDLLEVLDFCGINDHRDKKHSELRRTFSHLIYESIKDSYEKEPQYTLFNLNDDFYDTIIKCIQDFYWWGHKFEHSFGHIYIRVVNALEITTDQIDVHFK